MENTMIVLSLRGKIFTVAKDRLIKVIGTYFYGMLSSGVWQPNSDGVYVIDRPSDGFDRILDCLSTGKLDCKGLTDNEIDCVYANLDYFLVPFTRVWDYSNVSQVKGLHLTVSLQLQDGRLCCNNDSSSISIYNMDTNIIEKSMKGHRDTIVGIFQLQDGRLCSYSYDFSIRLWNIKSGLLELTIEHTNHIFCVIQLIDGRLCSGSNDMTIKIWSKDTGACELTINADDWPTRIAQLRDGRICSGGSSGIIKIWNIFTGVCEMTLNGHTYSVWALVVIDELRICSCSDDKFIKIWNRSSGVCERTLEGHTGRVLDMALLLDGRLCSVYSDGIVKIWTIETGVCDLSVIIAGSYLGRVIQLHDGRLVVSDSRRVVHIVGG
jgi:WD40 repeat protein